MEHDLPPAPPRCTPGRPADDELAGLMLTIFEHVDALGIYTFDADRRAGQLRPLRAA